MLPEKHITIVEGSIGAGKSTFAKSLHRYLSNKNVETIYFPEFVNQPLLELYLSDMKKYAFSFQVIMARERIQILKKAIEYAKDNKYVIIDRSLLGDYAFAIMQYDNGNITDAEFEVYKSLIEYEKNIIGNHINSDDMIILYLNCSSETSLERIRVRNRGGECDGYNIDYLNNLSKSYEKSLELNKYIKRLNIDWNDNKKLTDDFIQNDTIEDIIKQI